MATVRKIKSDQVYELKIELLDIEPVIWRKFQVNADVVLPDLHKIIQTVMGWTNTHLHHFEKNKKFYALPDEEDLHEVIDYRKIKLNLLVSSVDETFTYMYDFGDGWDHLITLEKILPLDTAAYYPVCVEGERHCPPEDCGGSCGYEELLKIIKNPRHKEYKETIDWLGGEFDPEEFTIDEINEMLRQKDYGCIDIFD